MYRIFLLFAFLCYFWSTTAQDLYFPPSNAAGNWAESDDVCNANQLTDLAAFLDEKNTKAFMILKGGKLVTEMYFDDFAQDSIWYWASAGKSLVSVMIGKAQQEGDLSIEEATADYLGQGWTTCSPSDENKITIKHQISMSTGLDETVSFDCTDAACLECVTTPGTRWFYHNAPYTLTQSVLEAATGQTPTAYFNSRFGNVIGGLGAFIKINYDHVFFSTARTMARVGLLVLAQGNWDDTQIYEQDAYFDQMIQSSQNKNLAYGYLWWLNGTENYQLPGSTITFNGSLIPSAPDDLFAAMGKNDQRLYIVPSQDLVVVRMGDSADGINFALSAFDVQLWERIAALDCLSTEDLAINQSDLTLFPNPTTGQIHISGNDAFSVECEILDIHARVAARFSKPHFDISHLNPGIYFLKLMGVDKKKKWNRLVLTE